MNTPLNRIFRATVVALLVSFSGVLYADDDVTAKGTFSGRNDHVVKGTAKIVEKDGAYTLVLGSDFSLDSAPDPWVGFGKDGYKQESEIGKLKNKIGEQTYPLPKSFDPSKYNEVVVWCKKFSVPLGIAKLK